MSSPFLVSSMSGNFDVPQATANTIGSDNSTPTTMDPRAAARSGMTDSQRSLYRLQRENEERRMIFDSEYRHYTASHGSTRRQHHEDQAVANHNFPTSTVRPRVLGSRLRRRVTGSVNSPQRGPVQFSPASFGIDLPEPQPRVSSPNMATAEYSGETEVNRRRKRRKLDDDDSNGRMRGFRYGWKGQVVAGQLNMEIHECDGGLHPEAAAQDRHQYRQDNLLRNDKSVYCTDKSKCHVILRHMGETCFTLKKLVIKAPERGFTAPIQEGMIFVSMTDKDLIPRTSRYRVRSQPLPEADWDEDLSIHSVAPSEVRPVSRRRDGTSHPIPPPISNNIPRAIIRPPLQIPVSSASIARSHDLDWRDVVPREWAEEMNLARPRYPWNSRTPLLPDDSFHVTTHCDQPSEDEEVESSPQTLADRYEREHLQREHVLPSFSPSSDEGAEEAIERAVRARRSGIPAHHLSGARRRTRRRDSPSRIEVAFDGERSVDGTDVLAPHARFFIESEKSTVTVAFDPPVSGKYILLKLWSPGETQNIDIQSIVAHGFAGQRMFPATQMM